jgi:hypothetical protein
VLPWKPWKKEQVPVFIGTRDPVIDTEDTVVIDTGESVQEEEEASSGTEDANSPGPSGNDGVNLIGGNMPEGPRSEEPETDDSALSRPKRRYRIVASTDFN